MQPAINSAMRYAAITAIGRFLPDERLTNADLERIVDTDDEWIRTRTGIRERRILRDPDKASAYMASKAAQDLLEKRGLDPEEIDVIIVATITPDMFFPATACLVQESIGASNAWGFDLSAACSGFLFALATGAQMIESGRHEKVLVIGSDKMTGITNFEDRATCVLFGDAAAAVLLEPDPGECGIIDFYQRIDGKHADLLSMPGGGSLNPPTYETVAKGMHFLQQQGRAVFKYAVDGMARSAEEIMKRHNLGVDDIRYLVPHQANQRIIHTTARQMGLDSDKVILNIDRYGNTTAATIPLCFADRESELRRGDVLILVAFGGGFTWGSCYLRWAYDGSKVVGKEAEVRVAAEL